MLFNSYFFIAIFLPLTLLSYYYIAPLLNFRSLSKHQCRLFVLLIASLIFYGYWNPIYLVLIGVSILFNFFIGLKIHSLIKPLEKKTLLFLGIFFGHFWPLRSLKKMFVASDFPDAHFFISIGTPKSQIPSAKRV